MAYDSPLEQLTLLTGKFEDQYGGTAQSGRRDNAELVLTCVLFPGDLVGDIPRCLVPIF